MKAKLSYRCSCNYIDFALFHIFIDIISDFYVNDHDLSGFKSNFHQWPLGPRLTSHIDTNPINIRRKSAERYVVEGSLGIDFITNAKRPLEQQQVK